MESSTTFLLTALILISSYTHSTSAARYPTSKINTEFIRTSCLATHIPNFVIAHSRATQTQSKRALTSLLARPSRDCVEELSDSVDELKRSMGEMSKCCFDGMRVRGSDGFGGNDMKWNLKTVVRGKIVNVAQLTSNALALINKYALIHGYALFWANLKLMASLASQGDSSVNNPRNQVVDAPPSALATPLPVVIPIVRAHDPDEFLFTQDHVCPVSCRSSRSQP
ncbi:hypothetical protein F8388_020515 [Cannabis sativa]|uniref:Pectinesterase inhibitor domain-containing protein n=1 Tax=Cannabis sativa TaxID=3483 RepID=A0A7J6EZC8_CANSA|nr:hypothetical protein F8388_020515 [Cannabis sativa]